MIDAMHTVFAHDMCRRTKDMVMTTLLNPSSKFHCDTVASNRQVEVLCTIAR